LFCYFLSPFLLEGIRNINSSIIIFSIVSFIRVAIEELIENGAQNFMKFNFHYGPVIRLMEFYLGMITLSNKLKVNDSFIFKN